MKKVRRHDLDWLRVIVFGLLIFYHVGMFFVPWGFHLKNNVIYEWLTYPMLFVNQWRLSILFVISGMGTYYALSHRTIGVYIKERLVRLGLPLIFGVLVIVPPQLYFERLDDGSFTGSFLEYFTNVSLRGGTYPEGNLSWHHLWFLPYLLIFSLLIAPVFVYLRSHPNATILRFARKLLSHRFGWFYFTFPLILAEVFLEPFFNVTHALVDDWFAITHYIILFFYGYLFVKLGDAFWQHIDKIKQSVLIAAIILFITYLGVRRLEDGLMVHLVEATIKVFNFWSWILVLFAYSAKWLNHKSNLLVYCNTAVYPFYIIHQTVIICLAYYMMNWGAGFAVKFTLLSLGTFFITWLLYEMVKRIYFLRPFFGLKN